MNGRASLWLLLSSVVATLASPVLAEPGQEQDQITTQLDEPARREQARTLFERGVSLYRDERYREALNYFVGAQNLYPNATITFNIARTCERLRDVPCALGKYREYRRVAQNASDLDEVAGHIQTLELELSKNGLQQITIFSEPAGATVVVDGIAKGTTPWTGELRPGQHTAHLRSAGFADLEVSFLVDRAHAADWTYRLQSQPAAISSPPSPPKLQPLAPAVVAQPTNTMAQDTRQPTARIGSWTWVALGSGVAALGIASVLEALRASSENDVRTEAVQLDRVAAYDRMRGYQTAARVSAGAGAALSALGLTLLTIDVSRPNGNSKTIAAACAATECRLSFRGVW